MKKKKSLPWDNRFELCDLAIRDSKRSDFHFRECVVLTYEGIESQLSYLEGLLGVDRDARIRYEGVFAD